ncbi:MULTISPECIES: NAD(P)H-dependent oxidoreductase [Bacillus amyloliquefaciens group]|uniref:NAD(P)H-dependent oxidoreductase n=1 Tax=Bacillus amyloliquefaciens group TaxID=1938374 RepID=UPI00077D90F1|nr:MULTISPECIES: NAD(P)H-dependent oxidoreductase [Bacillus amyloliquefaciens group]AMQ72976.1 general stress protein [Bacillus amyloliquefaciens UMAF6614]AWM46810.1 flavodoxin family protein [Bacillus amyloliquefaciens]MBF6665725.1 NAD(P)H-dependent oxidoreductase [Bacillus velezensis]
MKTLVIVIHPKLETSVVNKTWMNRLKQEKDITVHDLYGEYPNFIIDVEKEQQLLLDHERIVFQFPMYWYSSPALLKQWEDDVLTHGWAYGTGGTKLDGKELLLAISLGAQESDYQAGGEYNITISELIRPFQVTANYIGMRFLPAFTQYGTLHLSKEDVKNSAEKLVDYLKAEH